jgi:alanyl-tRNA synthetase
VLQAARHAAEIERAVKDRLGCGPEEFARILDRRGAEAKALRRRAETAEAELAAALGSSLAAQSPVVRVARGRDAAFLRALADAFLSVRPDGAGVFLTDDGESAHFLVVAGEASEVDVASVGGAVAEALGGRGGGRGGRFQGKGPDPGKLGAAERAAGKALGLV